MTNHSIHFSIPDVALKVETTSGIHLGDIHHRSSLSEEGGNSYWCPEYWFSPNLEWHMDYEILDDAYPEAFEKDGNYVIYRDLNELKLLLKNEYGRILCNLDLEEEEDEDNDLLNAMTMHNEELLEE